MSRSIARSGFKLVFLLVFSMLVSWDGSRPMLLAQTVILSDTTTLQANPYRIGVNIGSVNSYDNGQVLKNLFGALNVGFEPLYVRAIWVAETAGTTNTFINPDRYDMPSPNELVGATYTVVESSTAAKGCTGTITANTAGPNSVYTLGTPCLAPISVGDQMIVNFPQFPTPELTWESSANSIWGSVSNGGKIVTDSVTPYDGQQSIELDTRAGNTASAAVSFYADGPDARVLLNGTYTVSIAAKRVSGLAVPSVSVGRIGGPSCNLQLSSITANWAVYTNNACSFSDTPTSVTRGLQLQISQSGSGVNDFDDVSFSKASGQNAANTSVFRDEVVATLQTLCPGQGPKCLIRDWLFQDAETLANWTANTMSATQGYPGYSLATHGSGTPRLQDFLTLVQVVGGIPYVEVPSTFTTADASALITYLATNWVGQGKPFPEIYLTFCNECWNNGPSSGYTLPWRPNLPSGATIYYDYAIRAGDIYGAMRSNPNFNTSLFHLGMDIQLGTQSGMDSTLALMSAQGGAPDYIELAPYTQSTVSNWQTPSALWSSALEEPWGNVADPSSASGYYQSATYFQGLSECGPSGKSQCVVTDYEQNNSTVATCGSGAAACSGSSVAPIDQIHSDYITAGGGQGIVAPLQALLNLRNLGVRAQNVFSLTESNNNTICGSGCTTSAASAKLWGIVVDMGGASSAQNASAFGGSFTPRPQLLGLQLANAAIIGPMFSCPLSSPTYSWPGDPYNGPTHALDSVPYLYSFCFKNAAGHRAIVLININLTKSYTVSFSGTNMPAGSVSVTKFAPTSVNALNEVPTGQNGVVAAPLELTTSTLSNPSSVSLTAASVTELEWDVTGGTSSLSFTAIPNQIYGAMPFAVTATSDSPGDVTYSVLSGPAAVSGDVVTVTGVGTVTVQARQAASGSYTAATATATFNVLAATPALSMATIPNQTTVGTPIRLEATSNSPAAIVYSVLSGLAIISGSQLTPTGAGTVKVIAKQAATSDYTSATATTSFNTSGKTPDLTFANIPNMTYPSLYLVSATSDSPGAIQYQVMSGAAVMWGNVAIVTGPGEVTLLATQAASGSYTSGMATTTFNVSAPARARW